MPESTSVKFLQSLTYTVLIISNASIFENWALAQIVPDNTLGTENSTVNSNVNIGGLTSDRIDGGAIRGTNLFHSFQEFNINEGKGAYFTNPVGVQSIFSRVTGSNASQILGKLGVLGNADLFLINPNGLIFGANAQLDLKGSFFASTTAAITFADGTKFSAEDPQPLQLLTISVPIGLQFGQNPGDILVQSNSQETELPNTSQSDVNSGLKVEPNQTLALVGGNINLQGGELTTDGGQVELGSVTDFSLVGISPIEQNWNLDYTNVLGFKNVRLSNEATVNTTGIGGGGVVNIRAREVLVQQGSQISVDGPVGSKPGGSLNVNASEEIKLIGTSANSEFPSGFFIDTDRAATGVGGSINIETKNLIIQDGAQIFSSTSRNGAAASFSILASKAVTLIGTSQDGELPSGILSFVFRRATGTGGNIDIKTNQLSVLDGAQIFTGTFGTGSAGSLSVLANDSITLSGGTPNRRDVGSSLSTIVERGAKGSGGDITLETQRLTIQNGALASSATFGEGNGGNLFIRANESVEITSTSPRGTSSTLSARSGGSSNAGNLTIETRQLTVKDGARVTASSTGTGSAGNLNVTSPSIQLTNLASLVTESNSGQGGDIDLKSQNLSLQGNSRISTTAGIAGTGGNGGDITINTDTLVALEDSNITANAFEGRGGNIQITTQGLFLSPDSDITASSARGIDGNVNIQTFGLDIKNSITPLQNRLVTTDQVIAGSCLARRNVEKGSFVITGTGGLPINPYSGIEKWDNLTGIQPVENEKAQSQESLLPPANNNASEGLPRKWQPGDPIVEAQALIVKADGRASLIASSAQADVSNADLLVCHAYQGFVTQIKQNPETDNSYGS